MNVLDFTLVVFAGSLFAGFLGSLTGLGGGVVIVPLLTVALGVDVHYAIGASLVSVIATSSGSAAAYLKEGFTNMRVGIFLEVATTSGAIVGASVAAVLPGAAIEVVFGVVLLVSVYLTLSLREPAEQVAPLSATRDLPADCAWPAATRRRPARSPIPRAACRWASASWPAPACSRACWASARVLSRCWP